MPSSSGSSPALVPTPFTSTDDAYPTDAVPVPAQTVAPSGGTQTSTATGSTGGSMRSPSTLPSHPTASAAVPAPSVAQGDPLMQSFHSGSSIVSLTSGSTNQQQPSQPPSQRDNSDRIVELSPNARYAKLNSILGKGAYKVVYKALDREEGYEVAWNCFQTTKAEFNELSQEIEILKRVRHPNIINFHDCWYNGGEFVFVTELMTSGTLREYIRKLQQPNMKIVKRWSRQILKGLSYLHSHNPPIIHRDIKCDNIFINGAHGEVKIGDMGTAKMKLGKRYTVIGTPEFMAPEMYEEKGYNEKVDIYAFGMCLLEMVTGEYPYSECTNAAQIYKKVIQGIKPECLNKVADAEVRDLIDRCICPENERWSVIQVLEHPFLTVEPEVVLMTANDGKNHLTLQVVFKGMDKLSVKFEFNTETDTAEEVVHEMIQENVLPQKYQTLITHEINRILRDLNKLSVGEPSKSDAEKEQLWRRNDIKDELERAKMEITIAKERALEAEKKAEASEVRARMAEEKSRVAVGVGGNGRSSAGELPPINGSVVAESPRLPMGISTASFPESKSNEDLLPSSAPLKDYRDEQPIEDLVYDTAAVNNRGTDKALEWLDRLKAQDVMMVGDLRDLHDEDWSSLGLTVFASRALRNSLLGKSSGRVALNISPKGGSRGSINVPASAAQPSSQPSSMVAATPLVVDTTLSPPAASTDPSGVVASVGGGVGMDAAVLPTANTFTMQSR